MLADNLRDIVTKLTAPRERGVRFLLDDFGTGYSSLFYLKICLRDQPKIDQPFVRDVLIDSSDAAISKTVMALAQSLGLAVNAKGGRDRRTKRFSGAAWLPRLPKLPV